MKSRRGLSSVVGAVFAVIALSSTVGYVTYSMNVLDKYNQSILTTNAIALDRNKEQIQVMRVTIDNSKFNITANNAGNIPIHLTTLWVTDPAATPPVSKYAINYNLAPGQSQIKIGQNPAISANLNDAYDLKLITDRGNVKEFTVDSAGTAPLNIQLLAIPASVVSGFKTELVMIVNNNGSSTLTNISPSPLPAPNGTATCSAGSVNPSKYDTLSPGSIAVFTWDVTVKGGGSGGQACSYVLTQPLVNGYAQTVKATITASPVQFTSTNLAAETGVLTINYTSFRWAQGSGWNMGWDIPGAPGNPLVTAISMNLTNNNSTMDYWIESHTQLYFQRTSSGNVQRLYIMNSTDANGHTGTSFSCPIVGNYYYCLKIPAGKSVTIFFGAQTINQNNMQNLGAADSYMMQLLLYGKFATAKTANGTPYAQDIPFYALLVT